MREIKFRAQYSSNGKWFYWKLFDDITEELLREETVCQYTGLKDKNGKEIYEGDILATKFYPEWVERLSWEGKPDAICEVFWDFSGYGIKAKGESDQRYARPVDMNFDETEVIGNIYENKDLLK